MTDINGIEVKIGDWVLYDPAVFHHSSNHYKVGRISNFELPNDGNRAMMYDAGDVYPWCRAGSELRKISEEEALIYILAG